MRREKLLVYEGFERVDVWLREHFPQLSRSFLTRMIREGHVLLNKVPLRKASTIVRPGDLLEILWPCDGDLPVLPEPLPIDRVYEDDHILLINKRPHMAVHPVSPLQTGTLVNALLYHRVPLARYGAPLRPGIVHRLDKETSGIMVVAKSDLAYVELVRAFKHREVGKEYLAIVEGSFREPQTIAVSLGRDRKHPLRMTAQRAGKSAITEVFPLATWGEFSLLLVRPRTGRTHQIRVHLSLLGTPIVGDTRYGATRRVSTLSRCALHAFTLTFRHPVSQRPVTFVASLPPDMREFIAQMASRS